MTPKEKAQDLYEKMYHKLKDTKAIFLEYKSDKNSAKQCALLAVDEIIASIPTKPSNAKMERLDAIMFWIEVKQEIEKL